ncbi:MAG: hypothetical protein EPN38_01505 [Rhodanobacteraceae bacterium]|nr:MAG: hypothetical protein EPN38_01505 [Rhodanobacteraceae bacterium]
MSRFRFSHLLLATLGVCALAMGAAAQAQQYSGPAPADAGNDQIPDRVARLAYLSGQVQFAPAGEDAWGEVQINRPMVVGDRLLTGDDGRAVLELGDASVRIDRDTAFDFLNLAEDNIQVELSQGTLNIAVRQLAQGENVEIDTPTIAFVAATPGIYRIDDDPSGTGSMVTVFQGSGTVYGENGVSRQVLAGTAYRFNDSALASVDATGLPAPDDFDRFCEARDNTYQRYAEQPQQYVPPQMVGGDDLYQYGQWDSVPEYGTVWYPNTVPVGWAPYRYGHWAWIDPWGWTWVDNQPWGFAPFHYGRWAYIGNRWGWMPGPVNVRPVYAPALVAFIGGAGFSASINIGGGPVGWFPLGPRDVYVPWFHASRRYFTNVNITNIRNVYVNRTVINNFYGDYRAGRRPPFGRNDYAYRHLAGAVTVVPRTVFVGARPVHAARLRLDRAQLARADVALRPRATPERASLGLARPRAQPALFKGRTPFARPVVARRAPAPRAVAFATREKLIARQHGQPLTPAQLQGLRNAHPALAAHTGRVKLVPALATGAAEPRGNAPTPARTNPGFRNQIHPIPARNPPPERVGAPVSRVDQPPGAFHNQIHPIPARRQPEPANPGALPSARFRHPEAPATLPRAPVLRPAERAQRPAGAEPQLPIARPIERAPQPVNHALQQQRQADIEASQRARAQQAQQQRLQQQAEQRIRTEQTQQQREQSMEQQRMQQQQREREQSMQRRQSMQQQRVLQTQEQRANALQRQPPRQREMQRAPEHAQQRAPERRAPAKKHPPESSGDRPL